jgi:glycosyltransferase involved in cell wall biosynthesis
MIEEMEKERVKVVFFLHSLSGGGAERVVLRVVQHLDRSRFRPLLILMEKKGVFLEDVPPDIPVLGCRKGADGGRWRWVRNFTELLKAERPDVIVSFLWYANTFAVLARYLSRVNTRLILSERSTVLGSREGWLEETARRISIRFLYVAADRIVVNSESLGSQFTGHFGFSSRVVHTIHNPLDIDTILAQSGAGDPRVFKCTGREIIVGMGRFSREKGFDLLIRAMARLRAPAKLLLLGEGRDGELLRRLAEELGIAEEVEFLGFRKNPYPVLREATVFVLPSRYEGFPNGLAEAMALGVPCVATRCRTGPEELIEDGENGLLVPVEDPEAMAGAIDRLLGDHALRKRLGTAAGKSARRYDASEIVRQYEFLMESVVG